MWRRNAILAGPFLLVLGMALPGCTMKVESSDGGLPVVRAAFGGSMNETETLPPSRLEVGEAPAIVVDNRVGPVTLIAGDAGVVVVQAVKRAANKEDLDTIQLAVDRSGDTVTIKWKGDEQAIVKGSLELTIKAPPSSSLRARTGNGSIRLERFSRGAEARTSVGSITVKAVKGDLNLHTGNGSIDAEDADGAVEAEASVGSVAIKGTRGSRTIRTGNGSIALDGATGPVSARVSVGQIDTRHTAGDLVLKTGNGSIRADDAEGPVTAETSVGSVDVSGKLAGQSSITTGNGSIGVALSPDASLAIDASTGNGSINSTFGLPVSGRVSRKSSGKIGEGSGGALRLKTGVGSIELKAR